MTLEEIIQKLIDTTIPIFENEENCGYDENLKEKILSTWNWLKDVAGKDAFDVFMKFEKNTNDISLKDTILELLLQKFAQNEAWKNKAINQLSKINNIALFSDNEDDKDIKMHKDIPTRGALKLEVSTATPLISAGKEFSIYVVIRNPFPVPVTIHSTETHIPVELTDQIWIKTKRQELELEQKNSLNSLNRTQKFLKKISFFINRKTTNLNKNSPRVAIAVGTEIKKKDDGTVRNIGKITGNNNTMYQDYWYLDFSNLTPDEVNDRMWKINQYLQGNMPVILRPGDAVVRHFILKTTNWIMFNPISHTFQIQVNYEVDDQVHIDTIPYSSNIRAAQTSSIIGAVIGSLFGTFVNKDVDFNTPLSIISSFVSSIIFAMIVVIAFARKSNVQQIVSIEDFWGGLFIGFMVGYSGESFINSVIGDVG